MKDGAREDDGGECDVRAAVEEDIDLHRHQSPIALHAGAVANARRVPLRGGDDVFLPLVDDLDRVPARPREKRRVRRDHVGIVLFAAEASSGDGLTHADRRVTEIEKVGERLVHVVRALERADNVDALESRVCSKCRCRDDTVGLDVGVFLVAGFVLAFDNHVGFGETVLDVAVVDVAFCKFVRTSVGSRIALERCVEIEHGRLRLVGDFDELRGGARAGEGRGRDQGHRLADMVHSAIGEDRPVVVNQMN